MEKKSKKLADGGKFLATNRKAFHDYAVIDKLEAGIQLLGTEVKSCRSRSISMADAYVKIINGEAWLFNVHIAEYTHANQFNHEPARRRRLLLHKNEILKIFQQTREKGLTVVPLKFYLSKGLVKVELGLCKGKTFSDKREVLRRRQDDLDTRKAIKYN